MCVRDFAFNCTNWDFKRDELFEKEGSKRLIRWGQNHGDEMIKDGNTVRYTLLEFAILDLKGSIMASRKDKL